MGYRRPFQCRARFPAEGLVNAVAEMGWSVPAKVQAGYAARRAEIREDRWEEVRKEAFVRVGYERNAERLLAELGSRDAAAAMRTYADEIDAHAAALHGLVSPTGKARCLLQPVLLYWLHERDA
jgi:hypothetical protein